MINCDYPASGESCDTKWFRWQFEPLQNVIFLAKIWNPIIIELCDDM